ncbi:MAG: putative membrane protein SirB2 [Paraglaciecola sp.]|jgi:uncharacterized membrane protein SirB2
MYTAIKHIHLSIIVISVLLFILRFIWTVSQSQMIQKKWVKVVPHVVDTVLLLSALILCVLIGQYPIVDAWLTEKVLGLVMYILMGTIALKIGQTGFMRAVGFVGALSWLAFIAVIAVTKQALLFA